MLEWRLQNLPDLAVLAVGQSNSRSTRQHGGGNLSVPANFSVWNNDELKYGSKFLNAKLGEWPFNIRALQASTWSNNLSLSFCREASALYDPKLVMIARGGHRIESFIRKSVRDANKWQVRAGTSDLTPFLLGIRYGAKRALRLIKKPAFDVVVFHQGEANGDDPIELYRVKFLTWLRGVKNVGLVTDTTPILVGGLYDQGASYANHKAAIQLVMAEKPQVKYVDSVGLVTNDGVHFDGPSITTLGQRYWQTFTGA